MDWLRYRLAFWKLSLWSSVEAKWRRAYMTLSVLLNLVTFLGIFFNPLHVSLPESGQVRLIILLAVLILTLLSMIESAYRLHRRTTQEHKKMVTDLEADHGRSFQSPFRTKADHFVLFGIRSHDRFRKNPM